MKTNSKRIMLSFTALAFALFAITASAQTPLLAIEFIEDDQEGFDLWPSEITAPTTTADFVTDAGVTSGTTTVSVTTSTGFGRPANRAGSTDGSPEGFSYQHLYEDLLHATTPTGALSIDVGGLNANTEYQFILYAWDPGATDTEDKTWEVTAGTGVPTSISVNFQDALIDNQTFALVFNITTTETGTFQLTNTGGLPQSAINGFELVALQEAVKFKITAIDHSPDGDTVALSWESVEGEEFIVQYSLDLVSWTGDLGDGIVAEPGETTTTRTFDLADAGIAAETRLFFRVDKE